MSIMRLLAVAIMALCCCGSAYAAENLKVVTGQKGSWDAGAVEIGREAGIFDKYGLHLDIVYSNGSGETLQAVVGGSADIGVAIGTNGALGAYVKGAPIRIIGSEINGAGDYWYVRADSPLKSIKDVNGQTIGFSTIGSSTQAIVLAFVKQYNLKARPTATGNPAATKTQVMTGQIDVGWATPPFGLQDLAAGKTRVIGRGNDIPEIRDATNRVLVANLAVMKRKDVIARFIQAYRDTVTYMYADPHALELYAKLANVPVNIAQEVPKKFFRKEMLWPDKIIGLQSINAEAVKFKYIPAPLTQAQTAELIQIPAPLH